MRRILGLFLLFAVAGVARGQSGVEIRIDPPAPTSRTPLSATISGLWGDGCPPQAPAVVSVSGGTIRISFSVSQHPCPILPILPLVGVEYRATAFVGLVPPGRYRVIADLPNTSIGTIAETDIFVRDAEATVRVEPSVIMTTGARVVIYAPTLSGCPPNVSPCQPPIVEFNGVRSDEVFVSNNYIVATVPATDVGPIDVVVRTFDGTYSAEDALVRAPAAGNYEPSLFDRILVPVLSAGPGAFGSQWTTDVWVENANEHDVMFFRSAFQAGPCASPLGCPVPLAATEVRKIEFGQWPSGLYLFPPRGSAAELRINALVRDLSRQGDALGTEIPIVREDDFRNRIILLNVPSDSRFRVALRIYAHPTTRPIQIPLRIYRMNGDEPIVERSMTLLPPTNPAYEPSNVTIGDILTQFQIPSADPMWIEIGGSPVSPEIWAFAAITNNTTQHVTVISPQ
jgi:hypothetical protein